MLRCRSIASPRRTVSTPPLVDFRAPRIWIFLSSLQEGFLSTLLDSSPPQHICNYAVRMKKRNPYATSPAARAARGIAGSASPLEKRQKPAMITFMETIKIDDPRLDESFAFMFQLRKGDAVVLKNQNSSRGKVSDGVYVGEFPKHVAGDIHPRGITLYEVKLADDSVQILEEKELQKIE